MKYEREVPEITSAITGALLPGDRLIVIGGLLVEIVPMHRSRSAQDRVAVQVGAGAPKKTGAAELRERVLEAVRQHGPVHTRSILSRLGLRGDEREAGDRAVRHLAAGKQIVPKEPGVRYKRWIVPDTVVAPLPSRSVTSEQIIETVRQHGPATSEQILDRLGVAKGSRERQAALMRIGYMRKGGRKLATIREDRHKRQPRMTVREHAQDSSK